MANVIQAIRGMNDILPSESFIWQHVETIIRNVLHSYGYHEIRLPIVEKTELFKRSIGEATDIVEKEMYTFLDRNNDNLTLRPEGTAGCVRAGIEHGLFHNQIQRLWYMGPYFRYERPQKGRYRQFYQCGVEVIGLEGPDVDAELILLAAQILDQLGLRSHVTLELNSLGSTESRAQYRNQLVNYLTSHQGQLDEDSQRRLSTNPLRILDSKNPAMKELIANAPKLADHLDPESAQHFKTLCDHLTKMGINYVINPCLVRGLDYYSKTVFEWVTTELGSQGAICAGGRYDNLIEQLGSKPTPALGFAIGMERLILLIQHTQQLTPKTPGVYLMSDSDTGFQIGLKLANQLRNDIPGLQVIQHCGAGSFKNQFKKADKSGAQFALILGEEEIKAGTVSVKSLRENAQQVTIPLAEITGYLKVRV